VVVDAGVDDGANMAPGDVGLMGVSAVGAGPYDSSLPFGNAGESVTAPYTEPGSGSALLDDDADAGALALVRTDAADALGDEDAALFLRNADASRPNRLDESDDTNPISRSFLLTCEAER
jgi:hypothetical protein